MKSSLWNSLLCASILIFALGCGKDGGSGGGSGGSRSSLPNQLNLTGNNKMYMDRIMTWYQANEPQLLRRFAKSSHSINTTTSPIGCQGEIKKIFGIFEICITSYDSGTTTSNGSMVYNLVGPGLNNSYVYPYSCITTDMYNCSGPAIAYVGKAANINLKAAISGNNNTLFLLGITQLSSTVYQLAYSTNPLNTSASMIYKIDTSLHSMYNPVEIVNITTSTQEFISFY